MKKTYKLKNLDCANCAAKMGEKISTLPGVQAKVNFIFAKLTVEAEADMQPDKKVLQEIISTIESDCEIL